MYHPCMSLHSGRQTLHIITPLLARLVLVFRVFPKLPERGRLQSKSGNDCTFQASSLVIGSLVDQAVLLSELQIPSVEVG